MPINCRHAQKDTFKLLKQPMALNAKYALWSSLTYYPQKALNKAEDVGE